MSSVNATYSGRISSSNGIVNSNTIQGDANRNRITASNSSGGSGSNRDSLKLYEAIIFSGPIVFTLIILFLFYFFYLRRHSVDWSSLRMRASNAAAAAGSEDVGVKKEVGLKKEFREMLPIIVYKESFSVRDSQCSVCLGDYQAEDKLQQIPGCGHTFHLDCIDHWLATHTTCPLCRLSLIGPSKSPPASEPDSHNLTGGPVNNSENTDDFLQQNRLQIV